MIILKRKSIGVRKNFTSTNKMIDKEFS